MPIPTLPMNATDDLHALDEYFKCSRYRAERRMMLKMVIAPFEEITATHKRCCHVFHMIANTMNNQAASTDTFNKRALNQLAKNTNKTMRTVA